MIGIPYRMEKTESRVQGAQPRLGEHTEQVLAGLEVK
jgi:crotonobetainyl-CoA:carnitine CoA-transferase CaiB-like acyl-CoA transferase